MYFYVKCNNDINLINNDNLDTRIVILFLIRFTYTLKLSHTSVHLQNDFVFFRFVINPRIFTRRNKKGNTNRSVISYPLLNNLTPVLSLFLLLNIEFFV